MDERMIVKGTSSCVFMIVCLILGLIVALSPFVLVPNNVLTVGTGNVMLVIGGILFLYSIIMLIIYSGCSITVTDKRVFGQAKFHTRVDIPVDSVSAVGTAMYSTVVVASSSGRIAFSFIKNNEEIHKAISELIVDRQSRHSDVGQSSKVEIAQSAADELKKFKSLYDEGIITNEEYEAKKKALLGN